jgi:hypothetical protein
MSSFAGAQNFVIKNSDIVGTINYGGSSGV